MVREGNYAAWFRTPHGAGTGLVHVSNGTISGGDAYLSYHGRYESDGDRFTATLTTKRHTAGQPSLFGIDDVELKLSGIWNETIMVCSGSVDQVPGMVFEATLIFSRQEQPTPQHPVSTPKLNVIKLPKALRPR